MYLKCVLCENISPIKRMFEVISYVDPCHHGMARRQVVGGEDGLQIWGQATNILNKHARTADKG
jgi:hypothetical protein